MTDLRDIVINHKPCRCERRCRRDRRGRFLPVRENQMRGRAAEYDVPCPRCTEYDLWRMPRRCPEPTVSYYGTDAPLAPEPHVELRRAYLPDVEEWAWVDLGLTRN